MRFQLLVLAFLLPLSANAQAIMEFGDLRAGAAGTGAGAGLSAGMGQKGAVKNSIEKITKNMTEAQKAAFAAQTQAINQYWGAGCKYEAAKQWGNAEKAFAYVLQVVTVRDGAKSPSRVPVLQKLVTTTKAGKKLDKAIGYQKSIVDFHKGVRLPDERVVFKTQQDLLGLYLDKHDYRGAEPVVAESAALLNKYPALAKNNRIVVLRTYSKVLRQLKKNDQAEKIEKSLTVSPENTVIPKVEIPPGAQEPIKPVPPPAETPEVSTDTTSGTTSAPTQDNTTVPTEMPVVPEPAKESNKP